MTAMSTNARSADTPAVLLVRPACFGYNPQTASSNALQRHPEGPDTAVRARAEFAALCAALQAAGVRLYIAEDSTEPLKPDAVFPNNWVSWHEDGTVVLYPMCAPNRRAERRPQVMAAVEAHTGFRRRRLLDLTHHERAGRFLEGTGSLVLDPRQRLAYACRSARTHEALLHEWATLMDYEPLVFDAHGPQGRPLYHTNVMLAVGDRWAVVCAEAIAPADRARVLDRLHGSGREVIEIDVAAMLVFAANILEVTAVSDAAQGGPVRRVLAMSASACAALGADPGSWQRLRTAVDEVVAVPVPTIQSVGGGSVRCMLAQVPVVRP